MRVAIVYGTGEGQTEKIAGRIADAVRERDHETTVANAADLPADLALEGFDVVVVGASVHGGQFQQTVRAFASEHEEALTALPSAFFSVSLTAASDEPGAHGRIEEYVDGFVEETGWKPDLVAHFAGALRYSEYGFVKRFVMRHISKTAGLESDGKRDYEYTDWADVDAFVADVLAYADAA